MCSVTRHGKIAVLTLGDDRSEHRLNPALMDNLISLMESLNDSGAAALVTTNQGKFFSNGLDLDWLSVDPDSRSEPLRKSFLRLLLTVMNLRMPTIAAVCGHASAGGFIFALAHDYVFMRKDRGFLYMSEIDVGLRIPAGPMELIRQKLKPSAFRNTVLGGGKLTAEMGVAAGIVDSAHDNSNDTFAAALNYASKLVARNWNLPFYQAMRSDMYPEVFKQLEAALREAIVTKIVPLAKM